MVYLKETTSNWNADFRVPCHTYMLDDKSRVVGYIKEGTTEEIMLSNPQQFDQRGRKFKEIK